MQSFNFDKIEEKDRITKYGILAEYTKNDLGASCKGCAFNDRTNCDIPCSYNHVWKKVDKV